MANNESRTAEPPSDGTATQAGRLREARRLVRDLLLLVGVVFLGVMFLFQPFKVEGASMRPALVDHERILVNKLIYRLRPVIPLNSFPRRASRFRFGAGQVC